MPRINIWENDRTTAGFNTETNFSVVVPGFIAGDKQEAFSAVADNNDIYEVSNQADFLSNVGKVKAGELTVRVFAKPEIFKEVEGQSDILIRKGIRIKLTAEEYYVTFKDQVYMTTTGSETVEEGKGKNILQILVSVDDETLIPTYSYYTLTKPDSYSENAYYIVVLKGNEGADASGAADTIKHYGNQIAYELLGLGYTVLYKKLTNVEELESPTYWEALLDKSVYDFRFIVNGLLDSNTSANNEISKVATDRGDCIALVDVDANLYIKPEVKSSMSSIIAAISSGANKLSSADKFTAIFAPALCYNMATDSVYNNTLFPAYFHYLTCFAQTIKSGYAEWYAAAGLTRGISSYSIAGTEVKLGEVAEHALEPRYGIPFVDPDKSEVTALKHAVNIIEKIRGSYILYGNRTAEALTGTSADTGDLIASHFLNIRQLNTTIRKNLYSICRRLTFDPNSDVLWINFCNAIRPTLEGMKADQGIEDYEIVRVATKQKGTLKARIRIVPIEAVEDFDIELRLEDSLGEAAVTISE